MPEILDAYRGAADDAGREPGEIVLQAAFSWAADDDAALEGARVWKGAQPKEFYIEDWHDPEAMQEHAEEQVSDEELKEAMIISADPDVARRADPRGRRDGGDDRRPDEQLRRRSGRRGRASTGARCCRGSAITAAAR